MNIRFNALQNYGAQSLKSGIVPQKSSQADVSRAGSFEIAKSDVVSIKADASDVAAAKVKTNIAANVNSLSSADRINALKESIKDGSYFVSGEDIAGKILERFA
ncbi:MAG: flagellar biosynthesis anti-sigma factor FlgM [Ruminococcus sp.]|nr:flagellar biosynthesis anti-sigma factor FlgM [Ruminococcus sp.]